MTKKTSLLAFFPSCLLSWAIHSDGGEGIKKLEHFDLLLFRLLSRLLRAHCLYSLLDSGPLFYFLWLRLEVFSPPTNGYDLLVKLLAKWGVGMKTRILLQLFRTAQQDAETNGNSFFAPSPSFITTVRPIAAKSKKLAHADE